MEIVWVELIWQEFGKAVLLHLDEFNKLRVHFLILEKERRRWMNSHRKRENADLVAINYNKSFNGINCLPNVQLKIQMDWTISRSLEDTTPASADWYSLLKK